MTLKRLVSLQARPRSSVHLQAKYLYCIFDGFARRCSNRHTVCNHFFYRCDHNTCPSVLFVSSSLTVVIKNVRHTVFLDTLVVRLFSQMLDPPYCLHFLLCRFCSQMLETPSCFLPVSVAVVTTDARTVTFLARRPTTLLGGYVHGLDYPRFSTYYIQGNVDKTRIVRHISVPERNPSGSEHRH